MKTLIVTSLLGFFAVTAISCTNTTGTHDMGAPGRSQPMADSAMPGHAQKPQ